MDRCAHYYALLERAQPFLGPWTRDGPISGMAYSDVASHGELMICPDACHAAYQLIWKGEERG